VLGADIVPDLTDAERKALLVTYKGGAISEGKMAGIIAGTPFQVRPRLDDAEDLEPFIRSKATDSLLYTEGRKRGIDNLPEVVSTVEKAKRRKTVFAFYDYVTGNAKVPEEDITAEYNSAKQDYKMNAGWTVSKIVVGTREAADSVLARLDKGESFETIARTRSRDPFTATEGGDAGFLQLGQDTEFDGFLETMKPGERKAFRSLEGFVVLWLRSKQEPRLATLEEAHDAVERNLADARKEEILAKWIADRRALVGVKIDTGVLDGVVLK
jgi:parvulin-like peptidyl-prolyl isomerase